jgi:hypothetical protein
VKHPSGDVESQNESHHRHDEANADITGNGIPELREVGHDESEHNEPSDDPQPVELKMRSRRACSLELLSMRSISRPSCRRFIGEDHTSYAYFSAAADDSARPARGAP